MVSVRTVRCQALDRPETARDVEVEDEDDCPACEYCRQHVKKVVGGVCYVVVDVGGYETVRRTECVAFDLTTGIGMFECESVGAEAARTEIAERKRRAS